ncbi:MAG: sensor domain-containing diguanylate cyclase [Rhodospirillaceae bacterium]|jgi:diguanylate cyclase (GGDEF)-like protein/PAS domain S-box-containing protein|nr:sensor domain-containing diguanylate cyclase [Rhodospirillales bacterium]MBT3905010.1 sensor domain-containing diguanylate cyclase [Rhodospirillaceae bacterium]MBT4702713.1 sensor domain-containing diguanylate cyclase [Rhodospirillaceae bacterium]MBT5034665.1 sensor domain-containing diguanylate cyclase [Rhodospirillaceae bacterium]MBT6218271.1 sensor domain-containing diguanylate cyclase [Rhodospirillaceae bacterium]
MTGSEAPQLTEEPPEQALVSDYAGAAILVDSAKAIIGANAKGQGLEALLKRGLAPEISALMDQALDTARITSGTVILSGTKGDVILDVTVIPRTPEDGLIVLTNDQTMERNLRSALVESRQRFKDLVEISSDFAWEIGADGTFVFVSPRGALGYPADELVGHRPEDFVINAEDYTPLPFLSKTGIEDMELWMRQADGTAACVVISSLPLTTTDSTWQGTRGICRNVTEDREREAALTRSRHREQLLGYIVGTIRDELDPSNMLTAASAATARGLSAAGCSIFRQNEAGEFIVAAEYGDVGDKNENNSVIEQLGNEGEVIETEIGAWQVLATATHYRHSPNGLICIWKPADQGTWADDMHILIVDVASQLGIANEQITNHEHILNLSRTDAMTGLLNRRAFFEEEIPRRLARLAHNENLACLFYVDMDNFKKVNDIHGHQRGDEAIYFLRDMLLEHSRPGDVIARLGGDEFAMWLDGINADVAEERAKDLIDASKSLHKFSGDDEHPLGLSVGVALYDPATNEHIDQLVARADNAMYEIKNKGKGGYIMAGPLIESDDLSRKKLQVGAKTP